ncbi:MAG TPA: hypothetical protein VGO96_20860 [Pyrinomonadaceae bacterium]|nr:hypothetical protein [Pyrinomonadaceae bacterium]
MNQNEKLLSLVQEALSELDQPNYKLSSVIRKSIRIARLRNDFDNLYWLELEMVDMRDKWNKDHLTSNLRQHYKADEFEILNKRVYETIIEARTSHNSEQVYAPSVPDIEGLRETLTDNVQSFKKGSLHEFDTKEMIASLDRILKRIEHRVFDFLSLSEKQLIDGQRNSDFFERTRQYVDTRLSLLSVSALQQLTTAYVKTNRR